MKENVEPIVTVELGEMLKNEGFNLKAQSVWLSDEEYAHHYSVVPLDWNKHEGMISLPTLSQAKQWFRETFDIDVNVWAEFYKDGYTWNVQVMWWTNQNDTNGDFPFHNGTMSYGDNGEFDSYEHALENGLRLAVKRLEYPMGVDDSLSNEETQELHKVLTGYFKDG